ncbi:MAG: ArsR family transcriptional regulator [Deltaproteobacteria bacterium HGW-Deltaproteobacteria-17]|nr:MAG: ArsR family transcriptional regulator [Deltaproteobacteria bacterium HGW-Deltaproteobacteria-17]
MREYADAYKAMADETRLTILALLLQHGECCVCDVMEVCGITQSKASRHLQTLRRAGLLLDRRDGTWVYYRIAYGATGPAGEILDTNKTLLIRLQADEIARRVTAWNHRKAGAGSCRQLPPG